MRVFLFVFVNILSYELNKALADSFPVATYTGSNSGQDKQYSEIGPVSLLMLLQMIVCQCSAGFTLPAALHRVLSCSKLLQNSRFLMLE